MNFDGVLCNFKSNDRILHSVVMTELSVLAQAF
jgi:hypothetical protein